MRKSLVAAIGGTGLLVAAAILPATAGAYPDHESVRHAPRPARSADAKDDREGAVSAADLLAKVKDCKQVSNGKYKTDEGASPSVPVCDTKGAVFWKADMDIDCDGRQTDQCNKETDPDFQDDTAFHTFDGRPLDTVTTPYVVVPGKSEIWDFNDSGIKGGGVVAVIKGDKVEYAAVGDTGPEEAIGEASLATARGLDIDPDPAGGGAESGVTYIAFKGSEANAIEDHDRTVELGDRLAKDFVGGN